MRSNSRFSVFTSIAIFLSLPALAQELSPELEAALEMGRCQMCHAPEQKLMGPSIKDIVGKFHDNPEAAAQMAASVREGSKGVWGPIPMMPVAAEVLSDTQLDLTIQWMLSQ